MSRPIQLLLWAYQRIQVRRAWSVCWRRRWRQINASPSNNGKWKFETADGFVIWYRSQRVTNSLGVYSIDVEYMEWSPEMRAGVSIAPFTRAIRKVELRWRIATTGFVGMREYRQSKEAGVFRWRLHYAIFSGERWWFFLAYKKSVNTSK